MTLDQPQARWLKRLDPARRPLYVALVEALEAAILAGELQPGDQLPSQRVVAALVGIDFTTVTRAYGLGRNWGLIEGEAGRGTFVRARAAEDDAGRVDLSMNLPPPPLEVSLGAMLKETVAAILSRTDAATFMAYHPGAGTLGQKAAGAAWLAPAVGEVDPGRVLVCAGSQTALAAILATVARPGDALLVEPLTYPGMIAAAVQAGVRLVPCPVDGEGFAPEAFARLCAEERPVAAYLVPTTQNPVASTMGLERRQAIAAIVRERGLWLIEDDPYSRLFDAPVPALASLVPERTFHVATLAKTLSPGLRIGFLVAPDLVMAERIGAGLRALSLMPAPLMAAVAATWIREGGAETLLAGVRAEARARRALAARILPAAHGAAESLHVWIDLPDTWAPDLLRRAAEGKGLSLVTAEAFAAANPHPNGLRISLGGPLKRTVLAQALESVALILKGAPGGRVVV